MARKKRRSGEAGLDIDKDDHRLSRRLAPKMHAMLQDAKQETDPEKPNGKADAEPSIPRHDTVQSKNQKPLNAGTEPLVPAKLTRPRSRDSGLVAEKPTISFSNLIKEAILKAPQRRLLLHEIYASIARDYPYFQSAGEGWKNSIRHNLSINAMFCKIPRSVLDDPNTPGSAKPQDKGRRGKKKGCYWILRDLTSLVEERFGLYDDRRRRTLAHLLARSGGFPSQPDCVRILPFTHVPTVTDVGRRFSDSFLTTQPVYPSNVTVEQLRQRAPTIQAQVQNLHGPPARSFYGADLSAEAEQPLVDMQPLSVEPGMDGDQMPWLATSPALSPAPNSLTLGYEHAAGDALSPPRNRTYQPPQQQQFYRPVQPLRPRPDTQEGLFAEQELRRASEVGPGTLPKRNPKDVWLSGLPPIMPMFISRDGSWRQETPPLFRQ